MKHPFDVNNENDKCAMEFWDEYHANCRKRIIENGLVKALQMRNKSLFPYVYPNEYKMINNSEV